MTSCGNPSPLGVYVHWPFCKSKCPYCDFNSHVREGVEQARWRRALLRELEHAAREAPERQVQTMFFGGGTPSLMEPQTVAALIARTRELWDTAADIEITLEANPTSVEASNFAALAQAGVNRVSLGLQALDADALRFLGRQHSVDEAIAALDVARRHFGRYSFDLIYARPGQTPQSWADELDRALVLAGEHLSLYQLTIERGTRFFTDRARGLFTLPAEEEAAQMFEHTQARLAAAGLPAYEISNHARPGAACRHNLIYWQYRDYVGVGPGAHGRVATGDAKRATRRTSGPEAWLEAVERAGHGTAETADVRGRDRVEEALMMGLRLSDGIDREVFAVVAGLDPVEALGETRLAALVEAGFLEIDAARFRATAAGRQRLNALLERLFA
ncbi:radical SAM family heme chaperone HemW [Enhydrobacter sp.]|jgi:oxygen-independent coproporphyrinogen-3 oxidase|uniref:radical SAM family heme chaperone HemW n=1 Tax=Enhydrobacter sp. TaxID=1894999 RepID=UPI00261AABBD|nr:radical SAM family heme chaperone HemW [Enhydrobacter sp.]WIM11069.1 MAG: Oxygen-independent coproporphyrinogen-III oxidase-like protein YggW [Enhydrobacter sp.]